MSAPSPHSTLFAVIVHHRGAALLDRSLRALLASEAVEVRVVVVANECIEALPEIAMEDERVQVVRSPSALGFSEANNLGVRNARERFGEPTAYFFVNNDAFVRPDTLRRLLRALEEDPRVGVVGPRLDIADAPGYLNSLGLNVTRDGEAWDEGIGRLEADYPELPPRREVLAVTGAALMIPVALFRELGGWTELYRFYYEDIDLCLRAQAAGRKVLCVPDAVAEHAISATAALGSDFKLTLTWRNRLLLLAVHWPLPLLLAISPRVTAGELVLWWRRRRAGAHRDATLQARAWRMALGALPQALRLRRARGSSAAWTTLLRPSGSVPEIRLPETAGRGLEPEAAG